MLPVILPDMAVSVTFHFYGKTDHMINDPNLFTRDAWEANAEVWDSRMGDEGNDFFNIKCAPNFGKTLLTYMLHAIMHIKSLKESSILLILYSF